MIAGLSIVMLICIVLRIRQKTARNNTALTNGSTLPTSCTYSCIIQPQIADCNYVKPTKTYLDLVGAC